jgi:hypothetical protein
MTSRISETLRKNYAHLIYKICVVCKVEYPRTAEFFYRKEHQTSKDHYRYEGKCINCYNKNTMKWKKNNVERKKLTDKAYRESENGFIKILFSNVKRSPKGHEFENFEQFLNCWEKQKKIYGYKCPYLGFEMTTMRYVNIGKKRLPTRTNISIDRILSSKSYSEKNIMFISWEANRIKGSMGTKMAKKFLQFVKERYNTDEVE